MPIHLGVGRVLSKVQRDQACIVLVAPVWKIQPWYPLLLQMLIAIPHLTNHDQMMLNRDPEDLIPQLAVWHISGRDIETKSFRRKLYTSLVLKSWRTKTNKSYDSLFGKWHSWCCARGSDPFSGPIKEVVDFLANLHNKGYQSLDSYHSAISWLHVGQHPLVTRLMKGVFNDRPPLPRYTCIWNVQGVLPHVSSWGSNDSLLTEQLSWKTAMLLALTRHSRSADLSHLSLQYKPEGVSFAPSSLAKQSRQGKPITECFSFLPT